MDKPSPKVGMYTCASADIIRQIPLIVDEKSNLLKVQGKMSTQRFEGYMDEFLRIFDSRNHHVIAGWIEAETSNQQDACDQIAHEFLREASIGMIRYLDCAKLFFIHKNQMPFEWTKKLDFKIRKVKQSVYPPSLAFILIYQPSKSTIDVSKLKKINPQLQTPYQELYNSTQSNYNTQRTSIGSNDLSRTSGALKKQQEPEFQRTQPASFGARNQQANAKNNNFSTVYLERPNPMRDLSASRSYQNGQKSPKPLQYNMHSQKAVQSRHEIESEYVLPYNPESMYEDEDPNDHYRRPQIKEDSWRTQNSMSQRMGAEKRVYSQMHDDEMNNRSWRGQQQERQQQERQQYNEYTGMNQDDLRRSNTQKMNSSLERTKNYPTYSQNMQKTTERMSLSPYSKSDNRRLVASPSPVNYNPSRQITKSPKISYNSIDYDEGPAYFNAMKQQMMNSKNYSSQSQSNFYSSQRGGSLNTRDLLEEDNGFMSRTQKTHSQAYPPYDSGRGNIHMSQKSNLHGADLLNVPLKNLDSSPTPNDLRFFQSRQSKGGNFGQMESLPSYPSYKSNNYKSNLKW